MRNLKKVLALVIAFTMMLSVVAFAGFNDVAPDADYAGAVELLSALDIIVGDDLGNFNPDKTISRAEMAAIICRIKGLEASANAAKGATKFDDVAADHWASGYVNIANQNGVIAGYGDGKFGPEDEVTYEAAVKMVVCALGFEPMAAQKGGWPTGYLVVANTYKISEGVSGSTRADVATLVYNALSTPMMDQTIYGADAEFEILDGKKDRDYRTLLTDMDIYIATGIVQDKDICVHPGEVCIIPPNTVHVVLPNEGNFCTGFRFDFSKTDEVKNTAVSIFILSPLESWEVLFSTSFNNSGDP